MTVCYWTCPDCGEKVHSPDIEQVGMNSRYHDGVVTQEDIDAQYQEHQEAINAHTCSFEGD